MNILLEDAIGLIKEANFDHLKDENGEFLDTEVKLNDKQLWKLLVESACNYDEPSPINIKKMLFDLITIMSSEIEFTSMEKHVVGAFKEIVKEYYSF